MAWDQTPEGADLKDAWQQIRDLLLVKLPAHKAALEAAAKRPLKG